MRSCKYNFPFLENKFHILVHFEYTNIYEVLVNNKLLENSKNWPGN